LVVLFPKNCLGKTLYNIEKRGGIEGISYNITYTGDVTPKAYLNFKQLKISDMESYCKKERALHEEKEKEKKK